jgi:3-phosphoshikimate 1-carboxyvinyltransferase
VQSTAACLRQLGVELGQERVRGRGPEGLRQPPGPLDCGNSGTTMRLLAGVLAGRPLQATLIGDASLSSRPMERVAEPLRRMGARVETSPLRVAGGRLRGAEHHLQVASAQVKSSLLLAGVQAEGVTTVWEPAPTRDHTERMLAAMGADIAFGPGWARIRPSELQPLDVAVPGDLSAAAFWLVAAALHPQARLRLLGAGVNPSRAALLDLLREVGVPLRRLEERRCGAEPVADLEVDSGAVLRPFEVAGERAAALIDELPVLAVLATGLPGTSRVRDASELRIKESDRITAIGEGLRAMGAVVRDAPDGWEIDGPVRLRGARVSACGDHRVAMALAVAGLVAEGTTEIAGADCVAVSYPGFWEQLEELCPRTG